MYESEIKVLGHIQNEARDRVTRSSGDSEYSISETPIDSKISYENPIDPKLSYDDASSLSNDEVTVTDLSSVDSKPSDSADSTSSRDSKTSDADIGTGIEVESEEKLSDEDPDDLQRTSMSTVGEITVSSRADISKEGIVFLYFMYAYYFNWTVSDWNWETWQYSWDHKLFIVVVFF